MTQTERLQEAWQKYEAEHNHLPASAREAVTWAVEHGYLLLPNIDPLNVLADQLAKALRDEMATDHAGRRYRVNHSVHVKRDGVQYTLWGQGAYADREYMEMTFTQRREGIVSDCHQLKTDVDVYNDKHPEQEPIWVQMSWLDFTEDVKEREAGSRLLPAGAGG